MHYLKKELERLKLYAKGLGIKVTIKPNSGPYSTVAEWRTDGSEIILYQHTYSTLDMCLALYHELSHHIFWVHNGRQGDLKTHDALIKDEEHSQIGKSLPKRYRKIIYEMEKSECVYQEVIHKEIGSKIPLNKLLAERDLDIEIYKYWYENGNYPSVNWVKRTRRQLRKQYGSK